MSDENQGTVGDGSGAREDANNPLSKNAIIGAVIALLLVFVEIIFQPVTNKWGESISDWWHGPQFVASFILPSPQVTLGEQVELIAAPALKNPEKNTEGLSYLWFLRSGNEWLNIGKGKVIYYSFLKKGHVAVKLLVKLDSLEKEDIQGLYVVEEKRKAYVHPKAELTVLSDMTSGDSCKPIHFAANRSKSFVGGELRYSFDFGIGEGFGNFNKEPFREKRYREGEYLVKLAVRDDNGNSAQDAKLIKINKCSAVKPAETNVVVSIDNYTSIPLNLGDELHLEASVVNLEKATYKWTVKIDDIQIDSPNFNESTLKYTPNKYGKLTATVEVAKGKQQEFQTFITHINKPIYSHKPLVSKLHSLTRYDDIEIGLLAHYKQGAGQAAVLTLLDQIDGRPIDARALNFGEKFVIEHKKKIWWGYVWLDLASKQDHTVTGWNSFGPNNMKLLVDCAYVNDKIDIEKQNDSYKLSFDSQENCQKWFNTGFNVEKGKSYTITASGQVTLGKRTADPNGVVHSGWKGLYSYLTEDDKISNVGLLVGQLLSGNDKKSTVFKIGECTNFEALKDATLYLNINDTKTSDNSGSFDVKVEESYKSC